MRYHGYCEFAAISEAIYALQQQVAKLYELVDRAEEVVDGGDELDDEVADRLHYLRLHLEGVEDELDAAAHVGDDCTDAYIEADREAV